jgi:predicted RNase H-like nuclease
MAHPKRTVEGFDERRSFLTAALGVELPDRSTAGAMAKPAEADDVLDATAAAWSARRDALGRSGRLPDAVQIDGRGLRMEMVY